jgi:hypothetical protein
MDSFVMRLLESISIDIEAIETDLDTDRTEHFDQAKQALSALIAQADALASDRLHDPILQLFIPLAGRVGQSFARLHEFLAKVSEQADVLASGNLKSARLDSLREVGGKRVLAGSMSRLLKAQNQVAAVAKAVARGDMGVTIESHSEADILSVAIQGMVDNIRRLLAEMGRMAEAFDFDDEMQAVVKQNNEIREIGAGFGAAAVGNFEVEALILDISQHARMGFGDAAEFALRAAIESDVINVAAPRVGCVSLLSGVEADEVSGAFGIVRIEDGFDGAAAEFLVSDGGGDALAGFIFEVLVKELRGIGATFADEILVEPLFGYALQWDEGVVFGFSAFIPPVFAYQPFGELVEDGGLAEVARVFEGEVNALANNAFVAGFGWADESGGEFQDGIFGEGCFDVFGWEFDAIALDAGEADFEVVAFGGGRL